MQRDIYVVPMYRGINKLTRDYYAILWHALPYQQYIGRIHFILPHNLMVLTDHGREFYLRDHPSLQLAPDLDQQVDPLKEKSVFLDGATFDWNKFALQTAQFGSDHDKWEKEARFGVIVTQLDLLNDVYGSEGVSLLCSCAGVLTIDNTFVQCDSQSLNLFFHHLFVHASDHEERNIERFHAFSKAMEGHAADYALNVVGNGPSALEALEEDHSDAISIICSYLVMNTDLVKRLNAKIYGLLDMVFCGYALALQPFRQALRDFMAAPDHWIVAPVPLDNLVRVIVGEDAADRVVGLPRFNGMPSAHFVPVDWKADNRIAYSDNVVTSISLPLGATFFNEIRLMGLDGYNKDVQDQEPVQQWKQAVPGPDGLIRSLNVCYPSRGSSQSHATYLRILVDRIASAGRSISLRTSSKFGFLNKFATDGQGV